MRQSSRIRYVIFLIGHGSFDGLEYKINIPGPIFPASNSRACSTVFPPAGNSS